MANLGSSDQFPPYNDIPALPIHDKSIRKYDFELHRQLALIRRELKKRFQLLGTGSTGAFPGTAVNGLSKIAEYTCSGGETTINFSGIPQTYTDLMITFQGRDSSAAITEGASRIMFNGDNVAANYTQSQFDQGITGSPVANTVAASVNGGCFAGIPGTSGPQANAQGAACILIVNYRGTVFQKFVRTNYDDYYAAAGTIDTSQISFIWKSTAAINRVTLTATNTWVAGTRAVLYGLGGTTGGGSTSVFTPGSVIFAGSSGALTEDNPNLFWDDTNNRLGVGVNSGLVETLSIKNTTVGQDRTVYAANYTGTAASGTSGVGMVFSLNSVEQVSLGALAATNTAVGFGTLPISLLHSVVNNLVIYTDLSKDLMFFTDVVSKGALGERMRILGAGQVSISGGAAPITPTAKLHIAAGSTAASTAPLKFNSGALMTTAEAGAHEFLTDKYYGTITTGAARKEFALNDAALTSGRIPFATTNGRLMDASTLNWDNANTRINLGAAVSTATADFYFKKTIAGGMGLFMENASNNAAAYTALFAQNDVPNYMQFAKLSSTYTTAGLLVAAQGLIANNSGTMLIVNTTANAMMFATGGTAAANERMRIDATGQLGLGVTPAAFVHIKAPTAVNAFIVDDAVDTTLVAGLLLRTNNVANFHVTGTGSAWVPTFTLGAASQGVCDALGAGGMLLMASNAAGAVKIAAGGNLVAHERLRLDALGNVVCGNAALATTATDGFLYIPTCAGPPTGVPTTFTGRVPIIFDATNNFLYVRNGGTWKKSTVYT